MDKRRKFYLISAIASFIVQMLLVFSIHGRSVRQPFQSLPEFYAQVQSATVNEELREEWKRVGARGYFNWQAATSLFYAHIVFGVAGLVLFAKGLSSPDNDRAATETRE